MLTLENLKALGADTEGGLARCINNEEFYFRMVGLSLEDANFDKLRDAIGSGDLDGAFEAAHALKGILGNVGLTQLYEPIAEMTEELRERKDLDYSQYTDKIFSELEKHRALL